MNRKDCLKLYNSPNVQKTQNVAWKAYKKYLKKTKKRITKKIETKFKLGVKGAYMHACMSKCGCGVMHKKSVSN